MISSPEARGAFGRPGRASGWDGVVRGPATCSYVRRREPQEWSSTMSTQQPTAQLASSGAAPERASLRVRLLTIAAVLVPFLGLLAAGVFLWGWGFHWADLGLL